MKSFTRLVLIVCMAIAIGTGCSRQKAEPESYRVVSYDAKTHEYVIYHSGTFDGKNGVKKMVVKCVSYRWRSQPEAKGDNACVLPVAAVPAWMAVSNDGMLTGDVVKIQNDTLTVSSGIKGADGSHEVIQTFHIESITAQSE